MSPLTTSQADPKAQATILDSYGKLPLSFEANHGQIDARVKFLSRTRGYSLFLTGDEAVFALSGKNLKKSSPQRLQPASLAGSSGTAKAMPSPETGPTTKSTVGGVLRMKLRNANPAAKVTGADELAATSNYFIGNDPKKWRSSVPTYAKVKYEGIYSGIDLVYYGNQRQLEYDFLVAPGADPRRIQFDVRGARRIRQDAQGELVFKVGEDEIRWHKPVVYQEKNGARREITARYALTNANLVAFEVAKYDPNRPLYIDPLIYSTYLGGSGGDEGFGIAVDSAGNAYISGFTNSTNFPTTNPLQPAAGGGWDAFVAKINPAGSALVYSTYLGGSGDEDTAGWVGRIAVDGAGNAYVTGTTNSTDFPTKNPLQPANAGGNDAFVTKLDPTGSALVYSTYLGGSGFEQGLGIAVDSAGNAYVVGQTSSADFPTVNPLQPANAGGAYDGFVAEINPAGSALVYSTYLGGSGSDWAQNIALDSTDNAYVTGQTYSPDFPTTPGAFRTVCGDAGCVAGDTFVTKINPQGSAFVYSTYLGGNGFDWGSSIAVDGEGNAYVTGMTYSTDFPTVNPLQPTNAGNGDSFVTKINPAGSALVYSTYLGGSGLDWCGGIAVDGEGDAYVVCWTDSTNIPMKNPLQPKYGGGHDALVAKLNIAGSMLVYSTYLGGSAYDQGIGIAVDGAGNAYVTGYTRSSNFPTKNPLQPANGGDNDAFVAKISAPATTTTTLISSVNPSTSGKPVIFTSTVSSSSGGTPTGTVTFLNGTTVLGTKALSSGTVSFTTSTLPLGLNSITAVYGGDSTFAGSTSVPVNQFVLAATTTTLSSSLNSSTYGQPVTFTAKVISKAGAPPDGETVTFLKGITVLGTGVLSGGSASFTTSTLPAGTDYIKAAYGGDSNFAGSTSFAVSQVVVKYPTTTALSSSLNPSNYGQAVTLTATVTSAGPTPTGTVTFKNGSTSLGSATLVAGVAKITKSTLPAGTLAITVTYNGDTANKKSTSPTLSQVVSQATTTTTVTSSPNPSVVGQNVTFKAAVKSPTVVPVGTVTFTAGTTTLGTVSLAGGQASLTTSALPAGTTTVTATYNGTSNIAGSSGSVVQTVN